MAAQSTSDSSLAGAALVVLGALLVFPLLMMAFAMPMMGMMGWWGSGSGAGLSPYWAVGMMAVWLVVLLGVGWFLYRGLLAGRDRLGSDRALEELRVAYARGDLTEEEYESRRERLEAHSSR